MGTCSTVTHINFMFCLPICCCICVTFLSYYELIFDQYHVNAYANVMSTHVLSVSHQPHLGYELNSAFISVC